MTPHQAGEGYIAIKQWIDDNLDLLIAGELPFDFGNDTAQEFADRVFAQDLAEMGAPPDVIQLIQNLPPELFPRHEEPVSFADKTKQVFAQTYNALKKFGQSVLNAFRGLFG